MVQCVKSSVRTKGAVEAGGHREGHPPSILPKIRVHALAHPWHVIPTLNKVATGLAASVLVLAAVSSALPPSALMISEAAARATVVCVEWKRVSDVPGTIGCLHSGTAVNLGSLTCTVVMYPAQALVIHKKRQWKEADRYTRTLVPGERRAATAVAGSKLSNFSGEI